MIKLLFLIGLSYGSPAPVDSLGIETVNGKMFVIHKVDEKETLFAISRRYKTTVDAILQYNAEASSGLEIGQIIKVPYTPVPKAVYKPSDAITHEVVAKETMFSISKKYGVTIDEIKQWNNLPDNALSVGQQLVIRKSGASPQVAATKSVQSAQSQKGFHAVAEQETMFSIAKQYGITVDQLKDWNNLEGTELKIGQILSVAGPDKGVTSAVKKPDTVKTSANTPVVSSQKNPTPTPTESVPVKQNQSQSSIPSETKKEQPVVHETQPPAQPIRISESVKNGSETIEAGLAELIDGTEGNRKYLALHRTAPVGTILKVRNEMNNREVFVRVMGKLPDTALTNKLIIRISKSAYDRLGAIDQRFRVEVTYYK